jgi:hypothetical protein
MRVLVRNTLGFTLLGAALGLTACSSGGDGGGGFTAPAIPTQPVAITSDNEGEVAQAAFSGSTGGVGLSDIGFLPGSVVGSGTSCDIKLYHTVKKLLDSALNKTAQSNDIVSVSGVQFSDSFPCEYWDPDTGQYVESGSESINASIADFNEATGEPNSFSVGDYINVTSNNCQDFKGEVKNGSFSMTINSNVNMADMNAEVFTLDVTQSFNNFRITTTDFLTGVKSTETLHGSIDLNLDANGGNVDFDMSGNSLYVVSPSESVLLTNFSITATVNEDVNGMVISVVMDSSFTVASTAIDGQIMVVSHFEASGNGAPTAGYMNITGDNSQLNITVIDDLTINVTLIIGGNVQAGYPKDVSWSELGVEVNNAF